MDKSDSTALYASKFNPMGYRVTLCDTIASSSLNDIEMIYKKGARHINVRTAMIKIKIISTIENAKLFFLTLFPLKDSLIIYFFDMRSADSSNAMLITD